MKRSSQSATTSKNAPRAKEVSTPSSLLMISRRCIGLTSSPQIALKHSNKSWNASLIAPNTFIQSPFTNRKIEPLIDNKGSHIGSLLLLSIRLFPSKTAVNTSIFSIVCRSYIIASAHRATYRWNHCTSVTLIFGF